MKIILLYLVLVLLIELGEAKISCEDFITRNPAYTCELKRPYFGYLGLDWYLLSKGRNKYFL